tara:strand:+ start:2571 stop:3548 length:978 start_codon:yes stop_codon:yes gene_type:complete
MIGATLDMRLIRYFDLRRVGIELVISLGTMVIVFVTNLVIPESFSISFWVLLVLFATGSLCWPPQRIPDSNVRIVRRGWWIPSGAMMLGLIALGLAGLYQKELVPISFAQPFATPMIFHSRIEFAMSSLAMGCVLGVLLDLVTRGISRKYMGYVVSAGLMVFVGIGANVGLDPIWIGFVGGIWFINTTIERRDVLLIFGQGDRMLNRCIFFLCGLIIGSQSVLNNIDFKIGIWFFVIFIIHVTVGLMFLQKKDLSDKNGTIGLRFDVSVFAILGFFSIFLNGNKGGSAGALMAWILVRLIWLNGGEMLFTKLAHLLSYSDSKQKR